MFRFTATIIRQRYNDIVFKSSSSSSLSSFAPTPTPTIITTFFSKFRGDTIVAITIPMAYIGVLIEAYYRTNYQDADTSINAQFVPSNECISNNNNSNSNRSITTGRIRANINNNNNDDANTSISATTTTSIVQQLERDGIVIIPNAISNVRLNGARQNIQQLFHVVDSNIDNDNDNNNNNNDSSSSSTHRFEISSNDTDVRQDKITWIRASADDVDPGRLDHRKDDVLAGTDLEHCIRFIRGITYALEINGYTVSSNHRIPKQCQISIYPGDTTSSYVRHLDTCMASIYQLGLLEYLRLSDYRERRITIILYLNDPYRPKEYGGALRCWISKPIQQEKHRALSNDARTYDENDIDDDAFFPSFDVQPIGGTLVIFQSQRVEHQVLPSSEDRYALTNWVNSAS